jgi:hypothetical protein
MYVRRGSRVLRLQPASFQGLAGPYHGMWKAVSEWPGDLPALEVGSPAMTRRPYAEAPLWFLHPDGRLEEDVAPERMDAIFGALLPASFATRSPSTGVPKPTAPPATRTPPPAAPAPEPPAVAGPGERRRRPWWRFWGRP